MAVTLAQLKSALKIDYTTDDAELMRIKDAVVDFIQEYTGISLESQANVMYAPYWMKMRLDIMPLNAITSVQYYNSTNTLTTMPASDYFLIKSNPPSVYINFSEFPAIYENTEIIITYTSGYGTNPKQLDQAVIAIAGHWYNNPEAGAPISIQTVPLSAQFILDGMRCKGVLE